MNADENKVNDEPAFSRTQKTSHLATVEYEIRMLRFTLDRLNRLGPHHQPEEEMFAVLESFLGHYRNIVSFLSSKGGESGDLFLKNPDRWTDTSISVERISHVMKMAEPVYIEHSKEISTYLAHCTRRRFLDPRTWYPNRMYDQLAPAIEAFEEMMYGTPTRIAQIVSNTDGFGTNTRTTLNIFPENE